MVQNQIHTSTLHLHLQLSQSISFICIYFANLERLFKIQRTKIIVNFMACAARLKLCANVMNARRPVRC